MCLAQVLLDLLAAVEYGTVPAAAQHILVQAALASLTLRPQSSKGLLQLIDTCQALRIHLHLLQKHKKKSPHWETPRGPVR